MDILNQAELLKVKYAAILQRINGNYRHHQDGKPRIRSQSTILEYAKVTKHIMKKHQTLKDIIRHLQEPEQNVSINTWRKNRAALIWFTNLRLEQRLEIKNSTHTEKSILTSNRYCDFLGKLLDINPPLTSQRKPKNSKKKVISELKAEDKKRRKREQKDQEIKEEEQNWPINWRQTIINAMPKHTAPLLVLALSGCRPAELANGVNVKLINGELRFNILGVKKTFYSGQEERGFDIAVDGLQAKTLAALLRKNNSELTISIDNAKNFSQAITRAGNRVFPSLKGNISAYCFRHQFAADLKFLAKGNEDAWEEISMMLGHQSGRTKQHYGYYQQGSGAGGNFPTNVHATTPVRKTSTSKLFSSVKRPNRP